MDLLSYSAANRYVLPSRKRKNDSEGGAAMGPKTKDNGATTNSTEHTGAEDEEDEGTTGTEGGISSFKRLFSNLDT